MSKKYKQKFEESPRSSHSHDMYEEVETHNSGYIPQQDNPHQNLANRSLNQFDQIHIDFGSENNDDYGEYNMNNHQQFTSQNQQNNLTIDFNDQKFQSIDMRNSNLNIDLQEIHHHHNGNTLNKNDPHFQDISLSGRHSIKSQTLGQSKIKYNDELPHRQIIVPGLDDTPSDTHEIHNMDKIDGEETYNINNISILDDEFGSGNVGVLGTSFNIFKCFVGIGILAMPNAFSDFGIIGGALGILIIGTLNLYTMRLQIYCKEKYGSKYETYSDLGHVIFGRLGKLVVEFCLISSQLGCGVAYLLFIGKQVDQVICQASDFCNKKQLYIAIAAMILMPLCWLKTFKKVSYISGFANVSIVFALTTIICYSLQNISDNSDTLKNLNAFNPMNIPLFFGVAVFNFEGNAVILSLHKSMKEPEKFAPLLKTMITIVICLVILLATIAYAGYGSDIEDIVTLNLPNNGVSNLARIMYCFGLMGSYPIQVIPALEIIEKTTCFMKIPSAPIWPGLKIYLYRSIIVIGTAIFSIVIPKFGSFLNLSGAFSMTILAFIMPPLMYNKAYYSEIPLKQKYLNYFILGFGVVCGIMSVYVSTVELFEALNSQSDN
eukprot:403338649